ncbi:MAG: DUF222 domain-containing protein [Streptosporangiaceae bacterium]
MIELIKAGADISENLPVPAERLEAEICALAGHLAAATCRFIELIGDYDERGVWAQWEMRSCAEWLSWKCQLAPGTAREHVRIARALRNLPVLHREFAAGRMSYSKIRELTRIATAETEAELAEMTALMTAAQVERFARAYHQCSQDQEDGPPVPRRSVRWRFDEDSGEMSLTVHLPPADGAVVLQALRAAVGDLEHPHDKPDLSGAELPEEFNVAAEDLADALVAVAENFLRGKIASADNADIYQVIVHTTPDALTADVPAGTPTEDPDDVPAGTRGAVSAETSALSRRLTGRMQATHPCRPGRCHLEDGPAISPADARLICCDATISTMTHDTDGSILSVGRRTRKVPPAIRRAVRERDGVRCSFPNCNSRRVDLHHIQWWSNGGETSLENLMNICRSHHRLVHAKGYIITRGHAGTYTFTDPATGQASAPAGPLPDATGTISATHSATITAATIKRASGERLDLHYAIWVALNNGRNPQVARPPRRFYNIEQPEQQAA